jgi:hypothetical protein
MIEDLSSKPFYSGWAGRAQRTPDCCARERAAVLASARPQRDDRFRQLSSCVLTPASRRASRVRSCRVSATVWDEPGASVGS